MALPAFALPSAEDKLAAALCAAELNEPFDLVHTHPETFVELFNDVKQLRALVPFATFRLLLRLANDERHELRVNVARALGPFVDLYPEGVEELLLILACDSSRRVRNAAAETLAQLLDRDGLVDRWRWYPDRAVEVLESARRHKKKL